MALFQRDRKHLTRRYTQQPPAFAAAMVTGSSVVRFAADVLFPAAVCELSR